MKSTAGKCDTCKLYWVWGGNLLLREAKCPRCKEQLSRTAVRLVKDGSKVRRAEPAAGRSLVEVRRAL